MQCCRECGLVGHRHANPKKTQTILMMRSTDYYRASSSSSTTSLFPLTALGGRLHRCIVQHLSAVHLAAEMPKMAEMWDMQSTE